MADYESVLCVKNEVFVYRIPARTSNRGYRAAEWKLDEPDWTGRLKVVSKGSDLTVRLEDKNSGELFAQCPIESYPSAAVEQVLDSSRYFVLRIQDGSGRAAFIGLGFADRGDSFDLLVSLQDHFKQVKREEANKYEQKSGASQLDPGPKLDLSFKEGQTIKINIATKKSGDPTASPAAGVAKQRPRGPSAGVSPLLPPPPGAGTRVAALPKPSPASSLQEQSWGLSSAISQPQQAAPSNLGAPMNQTTARESNDLLVDFGFSPSSSSAFQATSGVDLFSGKPATQPAKALSDLDQNWVNFD